MSNNHGYPQQLASFVDEHWHDPSSMDQHVNHVNHDLPAFPVLEFLISTAYQASLLREEEHPLIFRLILAEPSSFPEDQGPPNGLHRLLFAEVRRKFQA